jgi:hypothetical protein
MWEESADEAHARFSRGLDRADRRPSGRALVIVTTEG